MVGLLLVLAMVCVALALPSVLPARISALVGRLVGYVFTGAAGIVVVIALWLMLSSLSGKATDLVVYVASGSWLLLAVVVYFVGQAYRAMLTTGGRQDPTAP